MKLNKINLYNSPVEKMYDQWPSPDLIFSDGPYGLNFFDEDYSSKKKMLNWYIPHIEAWSMRASYKTVLLFCGREISWATMHPVLEKNGWIYRQLIIWDKGLSHIAGRVNSKTQRTLPITTEVVGFYCRPPVYADKDMEEAQNYLRSEWIRSGIPISKANGACGVKNAATRKYLTADNMWYPPPIDKLHKLMTYANANGKIDGWPYFNRISEYTDKMQSGDKMRDWYYFSLPIGLTNVIRCHSKATGHPNAKPFEFLISLLRPFICEGMTFWEPFGGTCSASIAASRMGAKCYAAEINKKYYNSAIVNIQSHRNIFVENEKW